MADGSVSQQGEELIAARLELATGAQVIGDSIMKSITAQAPHLRHEPLYKPREEKRRARIYAKIERYKREHPGLSEEQRIEKVDDLAGGRFIVHYMSDAYVLRDYFSSRIAKRNDVRLVGQCRDCIRKPKDTGFRALTQDVTVKIKPHVWFPFEVQILTYLAHDWDQRQHALYENRDDIPEGIHEVFYDLGGTLLQADEKFDMIIALVNGFKST